MKVLKFGGSSVGSVSGIQNLSKIDRKSTRLNSSH